LVSEVAIAIVFLVYLPLNNNRKNKGNFANLPVLTSILVNIQKQNPTGRLHPDYSLFLDSHNSHSHVVVGIVFISRYQLEANPRGLDGSCVFFVKSL